jgi:hypothetical protein
MTTPNNKDAGGKPPGKLAEFLSEFRRLMEAEPYFGRAEEWGAFFRSLQDVTEIAGRTERSIEGRWVLRSRRTQPIGEAERQARVRHAIEGVLAHARIMEVIYHDLEIAPDDVEPALVRLAVAFCEQVRETPSHLTRLAPLEIAAIPAFVQSFINANRKETHDLTP